MTHKQVELKTKEDVDDELAKAIAKQVRMLKMLVVALKWVAPISFASLAWKLVSYLTGHHKHFIRHPTSRLTTLLNTYMLAEVGFSVYCAHTKHSGQDFFSQPLETRKERETLFERCLKTVKKPKDLALSWLRGHEDELANVKRGNVEDWLSWAFFTKKHSELTPEETHEIDEYVDKFEDATGSPLGVGHNGNITPYKFNMEPVESSHRPLLYFFISHFFLQRVTFPSIVFAQGFGLRKSGPNRSFNYWVRRVANPKKNPLIFIHGISPIGLLPYVPFCSQIIHLMDDKRDRDIILLELPAVSHQVGAPSLLQREFCNDMDYVFDVEKLDQAAFVGHSYGTMCCAWIAKYRPDMASSFGFLDPGCFLLHFPKTLQAIVYKTAHTDPEKLFQYFLRSELFFSNHIRRHFLWDRNILFFEQIPRRCETFVLLSEKDDIMPVEEIADYFDDVKEEEDINVDHIRLVHLKDTTHGGFLLDSKKQIQVVENILNLP